jgi:hypothetical protein
MRIDRRLVLIGVMLIVLSMTMATQYATTKVSYRYSIVHPSNADIRFIGSDNGSDGRVLSCPSNGTGIEIVELYFGNWSANSNKTYTAAFGIVNEETMPVNITHITVTNSTGADYMQVWLHGNRSTNAVDDTNVFIWNKGSLGYTSSSSVWVLGAGNKDPSDLRADGITNYSTPWDDAAGVRYSLTDNESVSGLSDFVWVQVSIDIPAAADQTGEHLGTIEIHFKAS